MPVPTIIELPPTAAHLSRRVLSETNVECSILALAPGEQMPYGDARGTWEHVLFVIDGGVAIERAGITSLLKKGDALHLPAEAECAITGDAAQSTTLLRVNFAPREVEAPVLFTFPAQG